MTGDLSIFGVFVPKLLVLALAAYVALVLLKKLLARLGVYRVVWHPALFDLSIFIFLVAAAANLAQWYST
ncbi:DUF1656 domain-containing protein [Jiella endophytica]|uniref:DUF1656 domain-containing protein n=1 Tax=Jiella endophytica TaxID=2558362 RepID=A0A4Y8RN29_9HYPH|nr:DUF1656 domain-containing protein [Jiella endophytica]TFF25062.1 DUF1656 domain-containing protein [Jiella endophytica]